MACPKNRKDDSEELAGDHDQGLHLLKRILFPCRIIPMQQFELICMGYR